MGGLKLYGVNIHRGNIFEVWGLGALGAILSILNPYFNPFLVKFRTIFCYINV